MLCDDRAHQSQCPLVYRSLQRKMEAAKVVRAPTWAEDWKVENM